MEGLPIIDQVALTNHAPDTDFFSSDIAFNGSTPASLARKIEVQLDLSVGVIVEITFDGTNFRAINNAVAIEGLFNFSVFVESTDTFNIQTRTAASNVSGTVKVVG